MKRLGNKFQAIVPDWDPVTNSQQVSAAEIIKQMPGKRSRASTPAPKGEKEKGKGKVLRESLSALGEPFSLTNDALLETAMPLRGDDEAVKVIIRPGVIDDSVRE